GCDLAAGQVRGVLAAPGRAVPPRLAARHDLAPDPGAGDLLIQLAVQRVQLAGVLACRLGLGALLDPHALHVVRLVGLGDGFVVEMPALAALDRAQRLGPFGTGRADRGEGVPAGDEHLVHLAGLDVGAAELDRANTAAVG